MPLLTDSLCTMERHYFPNINNDVENKVRMSKYNKLKVLLIITSFFNFIKRF